MKKTPLALLTILTLVLATIPAARANAAPPGLTAEEQAVLNLIDYDHAWQQLEYLSLLPEKVGGSPEEAAAQEYVLQQFTQMGFEDIDRETFASQSWDQEGSSLKIVTPLEEAIPTTTYGGSYSIWGRENGNPYSFGNRNNGKTLVAEVVDAGFGTAAEFDALGDVSGKIALVHRDDDVTMWPNVVIEEAAGRGVRAVVFHGYYGAYPQAGSAQGDASLPDGIKQDTVGGSIPAFSISTNSAGHIRELLGHGPVTLQLDGMADLISERQGQSINVIATLPGSKYPDESVVFSTHIDTWWTGTLDDLSGVAVVLEAARLFSEAKRTGAFNNERSLVFAIFGSEELGGPQETWFNWLVGSYEYVKAHPGLVDRTVIDLNLDMLSLKKSSGKYWIEQSPEANDFVARALADLSLNGAVGTYNPIYSWVDGWSFYAKGGATSMNVLWTANADQIYHTQLDTMAYASPEPLKIVLDLYMLLAVRADQALVLPFNLAGTVDWAAAGLSRDRGLAGTESAAFGDASAALEGLRAQVTATNAYARSLELAYENASGTQRAAIEAQAAALNERLFAARKVINVWSLGEGGTAGSWGVFLRTHQHAHDIGILDSALAALQRGRTSNALLALEGVYSMEWGHRFSRETYLTVLGWMDSSDKYWGGAWDQQQAYVDVQGIYLGLRDNRMTIKEARTALTGIRAGELTPWLLEDLATLKSAWSQAAGLLRSEP